MQLKKHLSDLTILTLQQASLQLLLRLAVDAWSGLYKLIYRIDTLSDLPISTLDVQTQASNEIKCPVYVCLSLA